MAGDRLLGLLDLGQGHLLEVHALQQLAAGEGEGGIDLDLVLLRFARLAFVAGLLATQGVGDARAELLVRLVEFITAERGQHQRHHALQELRVAPEDVEGLVEDLALLAAAARRRRAKVQ
jgi:hypothetical protein